MDEETFRPTGTMTDDDLDEIEMAHRARMRAVLDAEASRERLRQTTAELDAARLELRRIRAAEAPGTDDEAFEGTGWRAQSPDGWRIFAGMASIPVWRDGEGAWLCWDDSRTVSHRFALDAMRAAVPGSV